jgi:hypothetical protein
MGTDNENKVLNIDPSVEQVTTHEMACRRPLSIDHLIS